MPDTAYHTISTGTRGIGLWAGSTLVFMNGAYLAVHTSTRCCSVAANTGMDFLQLVSPWYVFPSLGIVYTASRYVRALPLATLETPLSGPSRTSWLFGALKEVTNSMEADIIYEKWLAEYGSVFRIPGPLGSTCVVLADPQAISHFYSHETWTYVNNTLLKTVNKGLVSNFASIARDASLMFILAVRWGVGLRRRRGAQQVCESKILCASSFG